MLLADTVEQEHVLHVQRVHEFTAMSSKASRHHCERAHQYANTNTIVVDAVIHIMN